MAWVTIDLDGTKNGANTTFSIPLTYLNGTLTIFHNGAAVYILSSGTPVSGQAVVMGSNVVMGIAPDSTDRLWCRGYET